MKLQRILKMHPTELAFRGRQHINKLIGRLTTPASETTIICRFTPSAKVSALELLSDHSPGEEREKARGALLQRFNELAPARFFPGACEESLPQNIADQCSEMRQQIIENADVICSGKFPILGYGDLTFGKEVNWHLDPVFGQESPRQHWSMINPLSIDQVGDSKVVWELNRHQWLLHLGQAYRFTSDERYARVFASLLGDWMRHNPPGIGINWSSSLEVAIRMMSWCWALVLFRGSKALTGALFLEMLGWIQAHARFVDCNLSYYFSPNTHLTGEALGLFYVGTLLPELEGSAEWRKQGADILVKQMLCQVYSDGVYFEQSTRYQYYTVEIYLHFVILADHTGLQIPQMIRDRLAQMVKFLLHVRQPNESMPQIGDTDGGWLVPLVRRKPDDHRALFSTAALLFNNGNFTWAAGELAPETLWLLGANATAAWNKTPPVMPEPDLLHAFKEGGYVVMRSGWDKKANHLIFDSGRLGCSVSGGHGHADLLAILCSAFGEPYIIDAGTFCYTADPLWRNYFRSTNAHNTVLVDGLSQAAPNGPFSWHSRPVARLDTCVSRNGYTLVEASHDAYSHLEDPVIHKRRIMFVDSLYWVVIDDLMGTAEHSLEVRYQFAPMPVAVQDDGWVRARGDNSALLVKMFSTHEPVTRINEGSLNPMRGWISQDYGQRIPAPQLSYALTGVLPVRMVTVIYPVDHPSALCPDISPLIEKKVLTGLVINTGNKQKIEISDEEIAIIRGVKTGE